MQNFLILNMVVRKATARFSGFGEKEVAYWHLEPKFTVSSPAEAVGFFRAKNPQHAFLRKGSKVVGPMS